MFSGGNGGLFNGNGIGLNGAFCKQNQTSGGGGSLAEQ